ncbi:hypothetical protein PAMP_002838 [Pampus punctatissimus]
MASDTVTDCTVETAAQRREEGTPPVEQLLKDVDGRLVTLSDKINLCNRVLEDLKDLSDLVVRKSFQDVSLPQLK